MRWAATVLAPMVGQAPDKAVEPLVALLADPPRGHAAYRGSKSVALREGPDDEHELSRLAASVG